MTFHSHEPFKSDQHGARDPRMHADSSECLHGFVVQSWLEVKGRAGIALA